MKGKRWSSFEYCVMNLNGAIQSERKKTEHKRSILSSSNLAVSPVWHTGQIIWLPFRCACIAQCFRWFHTKSSPQQQNNNVFFFSSSRHSYTHVLRASFAYLLISPYLLSFLHFNRMKYARISAESLAFFSHSQAEIVCECEPKRMTIN